MPAIADFVAYLEWFAPCGMAAGWDNVGLLPGGSFCRWRGSESR